MKTTRTATMVTSISALALTAALSGCSDDSSSAPPPKSNGAAAQSESSTPQPSATQTTPTDNGSAPSSGSGSSASAPARDADLATTAVPVSAEEAVAAAKKKASPKAILSSVELDYETASSQWVYSIGLRDSAKEYEVNVDASNAKILATESEREQEPAVAVSTRTPLPYSDALKLAQKTGTGRLAGWSLDEDDGAVVYTFDFGDEPHDQEVKVDVKTERVYLDD